MISIVSPPIWFQLLATVLSQKSVSDSSPGDSPVKPPEGSAGKSGEYSPLACLGMSFYPPTVLSAPQVPSDRSLWQLVLGRSMRNSCPRSWSLHQRARYRPGLAEGTDSAAGAMTRPDPVLCVSVRVV